MLENLILFFWTILLSEFFVNSFFIKFVIFLQIVIFSLFSVWVEETERSRSGFTEWISEFIFEVDVIFWPILAIGPVE